MPTIEIDDMETVEKFIQKIGTATTYGKVEVDLIASGYLTGNRVVVDRIGIDLFAAQLSALAGGRPELAWLRDQFLETFPGANAGQFVGPAD